MNLHTSIIPFCCAVICFLHMPDLHSRSAGTGCACAQQTTQQQPDTRPASTPESPELKDIEILPQDDQCTVLVTTGVQPAYTIFKLTNPARIIIDLPDIDIGTFQETLPVGNDHITLIKCANMQDQSRSFLRITMYLALDVSYNASSENNTIKIMLSSAASDNSTPTAAKAAASPARSDHAATPQRELFKITDISTRTTEEETIVSIAANKAIQDYKTYSLQRPSRLVVDIPRAGTTLRRIPLVGLEGLLDTIRIGRKADKTRIVLDFAGETLPAYRFSRRGTRLDIHLPPVDSAPSSDEAPEQTAEQDVAAADGQNESPLPPHDQAEKISFDFKDADIKNVLRLISDISGMNMITSDAVTGTVTMKLENIPWTEALDLVLETNGLGKIVSKNIVRIETTEKIKQLNEEKLLAKKSQEEVEDLTTRTYDVSYAKATDLASFIKKMKILTNRGSITDFKLTNKLTVRDIPSNIPKIEALIREQDVPTRQVMIEAKIVQSNPGFTRELGIRWGGTYETTRNGDPVSLGGAAGDDYVVNLPAAAGEGSGGAISLGYITDKLNLDMELSALENEDKIKIISHPRVLALDNKEARIKQGVALPYLKLSEEGVTSTEFKDAVLELEVTPKITPASTIALHVFVTKNQKSAQTGAGNEPGIDVREVETDLLVKSGETVVIGGIYETQKTINIKKVPLLGNIPYVSYFFKNEREEETLTELLIFINVTIVENPAFYGEATDPTEHG